MSDMAIDTIKQAEPTTFPRTKPIGLLQRSQTIRDDIAKLEIGLQGLLDRIKGTNANVRDFPEKVGEVTGMPSVFEATERNLKSCNKLFSDLNEMF
jgi:hypothetical protein